MKRSLTLSFLAACTLVMVAVACSSSSDGNTPSGAATVDGAASSPAGSASEAGTGSASSTGTGTTPAATADPAVVANLVVNEIAAQGSDEWVELANKATTDLNVGDYAVTDTDKDTGLPKLTELVRLPTGTTIPAGGYLLIVTGKKSAAVGPYEKDQCVTGAATGCFYAAFKVSAGDGETVHVLAPDNSEVTSGAFLSALATDAGDPPTACRIPDKTGDMAGCKPTPGSANTAR